MRNHDIEAAARDAFAPTMAKTDSDIAMLELWVSRGQALIDMNDASARDAFAHEPEPLRFEPKTWRDLLEELPGLFAAILFSIGVVAFISAVWG